MPSRAFVGELEALLADARDLLAAHAALRARTSGRQSGLAALNHATVVMCVSAWEAYIEALVREALAALRPVAIPGTLWGVLTAPAERIVQRFNTPNADQVRQLLSDTLGISNVCDSWVWLNCPAARARERLREAMDYRHQIAHGVNPRPVVPNRYASVLPDFFLRLGRYTDAAVRAHLVGALGVANPWPA